MHQWRILYVSGLLYFSFILTVIGKPSADCNRQKRLVYGSPLYNLNAYDVGWFVRISYASSWSWYWNKFVNVIVSNVSPNPGKHLCGGSLLSPRVVQTACHCITKRWTMSPNWSPKYNFPIINNAWEDLLVLHHGFTRVEDMKDGVWSRKFVHHIECKKLNESDGHFSHDFALILTTKAFPELSWLLNNFAPVYTVGELALQWWKTLKYEYVCLQVGFGIYYFKDLQKGVWGESSPVFQHGWRRIQSYWKCYQSQLASVHPYYGYLDPEVFGNDSYYGKLYLKDCTWACTQFFGKQRAIDAPGDSGGPITCSGNYFALMTSLFGRFGYSANYSKECISAIAFNMYDNAANYREDMITRLKELAESKSDFFPNNKGYSTVNPLDPRAFYSTWIPDYFDYGTTESLNQPEYRSRSIKVHYITHTLIAVLPLAILVHLL